jgi:hypothetical protein
MAVEDHPLWPKWKACIEELIAAKESLDKSMDERSGLGPIARKTRQRYVAALSAYTRIIEQL